MNTILMFEQLRSKLAESGCTVSAVGIDLGTTKSCAAVAEFDPDTGEITCECVTYPEPGVPGSPVAVPSVVAVKDRETFVGHSARRLVGKKGFIPQRDFFRETKNEIGLRYTYWKAPKDFDSATKIATFILRRLLSGIRGDIEPPLVVTVPASFHGAQRTATLEAAQVALGDGAACLLDEPYAAFLDVLFRKLDAAKNVLRDGANILVFDFGGGTCDVAIFTLAPFMGTLEPRLRATSRYHRIGGGDIDRAIVHDHLIPQLLERYSLGRTAFSWKEKRQILEPQLLPLAERLKIALCKRITELREAGKPDSDAEAIAAGEYEVSVEDKSYWLESPALRRADLAKVMTAFLDPEPPPESGDEYVQRGSIFSPIRHALFQARLEANEIDGVLLAGSSSLIPLVHDALDEHFENAIVFSCGSGEELQGAIARGAALQALSIAATGMPLIAPVACSVLGISTNQGFKELVAAGTHLPARSQAPIRLLAPADSPARPVEIAVLIGDGKYVSGQSIWSLPAPVRKGEALDLSWHIDENQCLELSLERPGHADTEPFHHRFIAPIAHIDHGQVARCRMLEREQAIRDDRVPKADLGEAFTAIANDASTLGENEKALHFVSLAIMEKGATQHLMNLRGLYRENAGDKEGAEQSFRAAGAWDPALFNMALMLTKADRHGEALDAIEKCVDLNPSRAHTILKAQILDKLGRTHEARLLYEDSLAGVIEPPACEDWQLYWLLRASRHLGRNELVKAIEAEQKDRGVTKRVALRQGVLPDQSADAIGARFRLASNG